MGKTKHLEKTKKPKNQNFSENVWSEAHVCFFLVLPSFFLVFLVMTLKKLKNSRFFCFFDKLMVKDLWKTKKNSGLFCFFCMDCFYMSSKNLSKKPKKTWAWAFLVFWLTSNKSSSKNQKNLEFFLVLKKIQKKLEENQKKPNMSLRPNILWKVLVFCFFGFFEV